MPSAKLLAEVLSGWGDCEHLGVRSGTSMGQNKRNSRDLDKVSEQDQLARAIEGEVIPRLMLAHRLGSSNSFVADMADVDDEPTPRPEDVAELARLVLEHDVAVALQFVEVIRSRGMTVESLYMDLLAPTARLLGEMWKADLCDFTDVTIGLSRLQHLLHDFAPICDDGAELGQGSHHKMLLVPVPGELHTFGIMLVEEFLRRAGWECCTAMPQGNAEVVSLVRREYFDVVGISLSCTTLLDRVKPCIDAVRKASRNKGLTIMVGGPLFVDHPELVARVGADLSAVDGRQAVLQLRSVFDTKTVRLR